MKNLQKSRVIFLSLMLFTGLGSHVQAKPQRLPKVPPLPIFSPSLIYLQSSKSCINKNSQCVADLLERLKNPDKVVRRFAAWELGEMRETAISAVPALIEMLKKDPGKWERIHAAEALGKIGVPFTEILPALRIALNDSDKDVANTVATTIGEIARDISYKNKYEIYSPISLSSNVVKILPESEIKILISELEASLKVLQNSRIKFASEPRERIQELLVMMQRNPPVTRQLIAPEPLLPPVPTPEFHPTNEVTRPYEF